METTSLFWLALSWGLLLGLVLLFRRRYAPAEHERAMTSKIQELTGTVNVLLAELTEARNEIAALRQQLTTANARITELEIVYAQTQPRAREVALRDALLRQFDASELQTLCADLELDYDTLAGASKADKARELVAWFMRRGELARLECAIRAARPKK